MQYVFVLNHDKQPIAPCSPERARKLLDAGRAAVYRMYPFAIIMKEQMTVGTLPQYILKLDPGAGTTGLAIVRNDKEGPVVIWAAELKHKGFAVSESLQSRAAIRRNRRSRNTRYRRPKFSAGVAVESSRPEGWLAPSIRSRLDNIQNWFVKLFKLCPLSGIACEVVRFDMQLMQNADISGVEYQQGELAGYEVREYLLEKWGRKCAYCGAENTRLEIEHIIPKSRGGSDRVGNLCIACHKCNQRKGNKTAEEFGFPQLKPKHRTMSDAAAVNIVRWQIYELLQATGLPVEFGTGGRTKFNRTRQGYPKAHWIDAACVGPSGAMVKIPKTLRPLLITAMGRGSRQQTGVNKYGFPNTKAKDKRKRFAGFATGDIVRVSVSAGKYTGEHIGRIKTAGQSPEVKTKAKSRLHIGKSHVVTVLQYNDGYSYGHGQPMEQQ